MVLMAFPTCAIVDDLIAFQKKKKKIKLMAYWCQWRVPYMSTKN